MIELAKCPACGPGCSISKYTSDQQSRFGVTCTCGLGSTRRKTPELAAQSWNALCEVVRVGKDAMAAIPEGMQIGSFHSAVTTEDDGMFNRGCIFAKLDPIPAPLTKDDVLRECREMIKFLGFRWPKPSGTQEMLTKIDAVLGEEQ